MLSPSQFWLDGWRVCLNFAIDFADDFVVDDPLIFGYFLEGEFAANIFRFISHAWIFLFTKFCVLELSRWLFHQDRYDWILLGSSEFSFLVNWLGSNFPCLLFLILDLARSCRVCFCFYSISSFVFVSRGCRAIYFLVFFFADAVPFLFFFSFSQTPFRFFSCFVLFNPTRWHLKLLAMALVLDIFFLSI